MSAEGPRIPASERVEQTTSVESNKEPAFTYPELKKDGVNDPWFSDYKDLFRQTPDGRYSYPDPIVDFLYTEYIAKYGSKTYYKQAYWRSRGFSTMELSDIIVPDGVDPLTRDKYAFTTAERIREKYRELGLAPKVETSPQATESAWDAAAARVVAIEAFGKILNGTASYEALEQTIKDRKAAGHSAIRINTEIGLVLDEIEKRFAATNPGAEGEAAVEKFKAAYDAARKEYLPELD